MLLIQTYVAPSAIQGLGLFAVEKVLADAPLWEFAPGFDQLVPVDRIPTLPAAFQAYLATYSYVSSDFPGHYVLSCDHAKFMNHSEDPNTASRGIVTYARRPIASGEEITCDYRSVCVGWNGFAYSSR